MNISSPQFLQLAGLNSFRCALAAAHASGDAEIIQRVACSMIFGPNDSPLAGREGTQLTGSKIGERLNAEAETSVSLRVLPVDGGGESFEVQARGELQLGLLIGMQPPVQ